MARAKKGLGEILREADLISEAQLAEALALQESFGERLASILVRQHILTEKFAVTYLGRQIGIPGVDLSQQEIHLALLSTVTLDICEKNLVFPVNMRGDYLQLAMSDPQDRALVADIELWTGFPLAPLIALEASLKNAIVEARRAVREGRKTITPNVQRPRDSGPARDAARPASAEEKGRQEPAAPVPVTPLDQRAEKAIFETLGGAPLKASAMAREARPPSEIGRAHV